MTDGVVVAFFDGADDGGRWRRCIAPLLDVPVAAWVGLCDNAAVAAEVALVWQPPAGRLAQLPNLRLIISLGQGVDHLLSDPNLPRHIPLVRLVDDGMATAMSHWVVWAVLDFVRDGVAYRAQAAQRVFHALPPKEPQHLRIGVYGIGALGRVAAQQLHALGFSVSGWSKNPKAIKNIDCRSGSDGFGWMLAHCDIHICLLPLTADTRGLFDRRRFAKMKRGAYFINAGRGGHIDEADLLVAVSDGQLAGATLDVFADEPLPDSSPLWACGRITITPHIAAPTSPESAAAQVAAAITAALAGKTPRNVVNPARGY